MEFIDKAAVVAEIEKLKRENGKDGRPSNITEVICNHLLSFLDTLKVKDADLEKEIGKELYKHYGTRYNDEIEADFTAYELANIMRRFFELGLKSQDWEKQRMEECPHRKVGCTMYEGSTIECKGACSWVVDYPKFKELMAQKGE